MAQRKFILTEAAAMVPLVRCLLVDVREARARLSRLRRELARADLAEPRLVKLAVLKEVRRRLRALKAEADDLGIEISPGVRCEALFPFEHRWVGQSGDGKVRPAYFVYSDAQESIVEWYFHGWPNDRRPPSSTWWNQFRPGQRLPDGSRGVRRPANSSAE